MKARTLLTREEALKYADQWVCFNLGSTRVVSHGNTPEEALDMAREAGEEHAFLHYVRDPRHPAVWI